MILGAHFLLLKFFENFNFSTTLFPKMTSIFWWLLLNWAQDLKSGWLLVLGLKEGLVKCATVCVKSVVILINIHSSLEKNTMVSWLNNTFGKTLPESQINNVIHFLCVQDFSTYAFSQNINLDEIFSSNFCPLQISI